MCSKFLSISGTALAYIAITIPGMNIVRFDKFFQEVIDNHNGVNYNDIPRSLGGV